MYPNITDDNFYKKINSKYAKYKIKDKKTFNEICFPKKYELQLPQQFVKEYISPDTPYKGILVYHRIGAGKTCTMIQIGEKWVNKKKLVVLPASLKGNLRNELRSPCAGDAYISKEDREKLKQLNPKSPEYKKIIAESDKKIDKNYKIYSYHKFVSDIKKINFNNVVLMVDEIQNMISNNGIFYETLYKSIKNAPSSLRIVLLSATPIFDKPDEIALTLNLLPLKQKIPTDVQFYKTFTQTTNDKMRVVNLDSFKDYIKGFVSYYSGAPPNAFPEMKIKIMQCEMSEFQYNIYKNIIKNEKIDFHKSSNEFSELPNDFYIGTRMSSNIVFPNKKAGEKGLKSLTDNIILKNLNKYSCKFNIIMEKLRTAKGKVFIYSNFKEYGGIKSFEKILRAFGYKNFLKEGEGSKTYAIWSGDENNNQKEHIKEIYNRKNNIDGSNIKILLGSPSIKEGVSLTNVRHVYIIDPYWNKSRLEQVIGRASRYCSHKDLPKEQRTVKVYIFLAIAPIEKDEETIDKFIYKLSYEKSKLIKEFERAMKESAVDCYLNEKMNNLNEEEKIKCEL